MLEMDGSRCWRWMPTGVGNGWHEALEIDGSRCWRWMAVGVGDGWQQVLEMDGSRCWRIDMNDEQQSFTSIDDT